MTEFVQSLGQVSAVIGAQWGDEGKGKVTDMLAREFDVIARACGGANAGHTIVIGDEKHVFHLLPSGCMHKDKFVVLGAGMAIHLPTLLEEIETLKQAGIEIIDHLYISPSAHIVLDYHKQIDALLEERRSSAKGEGIGTTKRGIGPAYTDKAARRGLRMEQLRWTDEDIQAELQSQAAEVKYLYDFDIDIEMEFGHIKLAKELFYKRLFLNVPELLHTFIKTGKTVLIEGAQATLLDIDHGTYPYVTSSACTSAGAMQGLGLPPQTLKSCIGVAKAYCTRVGAGEFITEAEGAAADRLRDRGGEYGSTTGRPRRTGWLYLPDLHYAAMINGYTHWNLTKLDVLDEEEEIPVGIGFDEMGEVVYETLPGWQSSTVGIREYDKLPDAAKQYIEYLEAQTEVPVSLIGTGPDREDMIVR